METLKQLLFSDPGFFVGLAVILLAGLLLPGRIRWYFVTAGTAVLAFRFYQVFRVNKLTQKLDQEREALQEELATLKQALEGLHSKEANLSQELDVIKNERDTLAARLEQMATNQENWQGNYQAHRQEVEALNRRYEEQRDSRDTISQILENAERAQRDSGRM